MKKEQVIDILKKFWFVILVGCLFISVAIYFAWDTNKDKIPAKSSNGKDVIFALDDKSYTADEYYDALFNNKSGEDKDGIAILYNHLQRTVLEQTVDTTDDMEKQATESAEALIEQAKESSANYESLIANQLKLAGYGGFDDLEEYFINQLKMEKLFKNHVKDTASIFDEIYEKASPRVISHILVSFENAETPSETPTEKEQAKMDEIDNALKEGTKFSKVAKKYSEDTGTTQEGGSLGICLNTDSLDEAFKTAAWNLNENEVSGWVKSSFGYHLISIDTTTKKNMLKEKYEDSLVQVVSTYYPKLSYEVVWEKAKKLKVKINDKDLEKEFKAFIGVE